MSEDTLTDFALAAYLEDGRWQVVPLPRSAGEGLAPLGDALRQLPSDGGVLGLVSIGDDFAILLRTGAGGDRVVLSDVSAAAEWPIAAEVLEATGEDPEQADPDEVRAAGDLDVVADLGLGALELAAIFADGDAYPDETLGRVAARLGFGEEFDRAVDTADR